MDKLRRSFRSSFRRKEGGGSGGGGGGGGKEESGGGGGTRQWPQDEASVKANTCTFEVKYLGTVEVRLVVRHLGTSCHCFCRSSSLVACRSVRRRSSFSKTAKGNQLK